MSEAIQFYVSDNSRIASKVFLNELHVISDYSFKTCMCLQLDIRFIFAFIRARSGKFSLHRFASLHLENCLHNCYHFWYETSQ